MAALPETFEQCVARVARAGRMSGKDARALLQEVHDRGEEMRRTGKDDPFMEAASELAAKTRDIARQNVVDQVRNAAIRAGVMGKITGFADAAQVLRDILHGSNVGSRENVQSEWEGRAGAVNNGIRVDLQKAQIDKAVMSGKMDRAIANGLWDINAGTPSGKPVPAPAKTAADVFHRAMELMRTLQNAKGARIGKAIDYVMHTWHDPMLMRHGGVGYQGAFQRWWSKIGVDHAFDLWWGFAEPRLAEKTFDGLTPRDGESDAAARVRFGRSVFDALISGVHMTATGASGLEAGADGFVPPAFEGTHNIAKRVSQERVLFWKDADSWHEYNQRYGRYRTMWEGMLHTVNQGSRNIALMDKLGTNPAGNLNLIIRAVQEKFRSDLDGGRKFNDKIKGIQNVMARLDGSANIPVNEMWHSLGEGARTYYNTISLGGVQLTHLASIFATVPSELRHHGVGAGTDALGFGNLPGAVGNVARTISYLVKGAGPIAKQEILHDVSAYTGAFTYGLARNWNLLFDRGNTLMGRTAAFQNMFMTLTGLPFIMDRVRGGVREGMAAILGRQLDRGFGELHPMLQKMLGKYGIGDPEWEQFRAIQDQLPTWEGRKYLTPKDALNTPGGQALSDKLLMYYHDVGAHAIVTPGVREQATLYGASRPGSLQHEMMHMLMQFKIWPVAAMNQIAGREIHMALSKTDAAWGVGLTLALSTLAGLARMTVHDLAQGNPPKDPRDPYNLLEGLKQGGGLGIFGDLLFGEVNRMQSGGISTFGGPMVSDADTLTKIYGRWRVAERTGRNYSPWPDIAHFAINHVPFANLIYLKGALDYMLWFHVLEAASPGWWERTNRRLAAEQGRTMTGYVPGGGVPFGVPGIYMQNPSGQSFGALGQH